MEYVTDTHPLVWSLFASNRLSTRVRDLFQRVELGEHIIVIPAVVIAELIMVVEKGRVSGTMPELLQGLALRPKEPPLAPDTVNLLTIHAAKGLEFDHVWVMGLAESVLPSWQSLKPDASPAELEEERRNCFVAITRTKQSLVLSRANTYRNWSKQPSRFIGEMGISGA